jgi:hypothetical protein
VSSNERSDHPGDLDLEKGLPTTAEDVAIQRRLNRELRISPEAYKAFLESLGPRPYKELRARKTLRGEPFRL